MRLIAIGDVHGHSKAFESLLQQIQPEASDRIVLLGDLINRGPDSRGVLDQVLELDGKCMLTTLLGNHEIMALGAIDSRDGFNFWLKFGGDATLRSYGLPVPQRTQGPFDFRSLPREHVVLLSTMRDYHETDQHIFVHASYHPGLTMPQQPSQVLHWSRFDPNGRPHHSGKRVICGHTAGTQVVDLGHMVCIDTGCGVLPHGQLTAMEVNTGQLWQVPVPLV